MNIDNANNNLQSAIDMQNRKKLKHSKKRKDRDSRNGINVHIAVYKIGRICFTSDKSLIQINIIRAGTEKQPKQTNTTNIIK